MTRKRYKKLIMGMGFRRNVAQMLAASVRRNGLPYLDAYVLFIAIYLKATDEKR